MMEIYRGKVVEIVINDEQPVSMELIQDHYALEEYTTHL